MNLKAVKKRKDFATERLYAEFVFKTAEAGSMVRVRGACKAVKVRGSRSSIELREGDVGIVHSKEEEQLFYGLFGHQMTVKFGKHQVSLSCQNVEVLA